MRTWQDLVTLAREAHKQSVPWSSFWPTVAADVRRLQAACSASRQSLYGRLLAIVVSGGEIVEPPAVEDLTLHGGLAF